jgi:hypothetical protein
VEGAPLAALPSMLRGMRIRSFALLALLAVAACGKSSDKPTARKLRKMDFHTTIDDRGRIKLAFRMFDAKHELMPVAGSYTVEVTKLDGSLLCKAGGELAPTDFSEKGTHKPPWHDASCPADPGTDEVKVNVKVTVPGGSPDKDGKGDKDKGKDKDKDKDAAKDTTFDRSITIPVRSIYDRPPARKPAETKPADGSATKPAETKPADGSAAKPAETKPAETKPGDGSAAKPAEKPAAEKPAAEKPAAEKPAAEKPAAEKPAAEKPAASKAAERDPELTPGGAR